MKICIYWNEKSIYYSKVNYKIIEMQFDLHLKREYLN